MAGELKLVQIMQGDGKAIVPEMPVKKILGQQCPVVRRMRVRRQQHDLAPPTLTAQRIRRRETRRPAADDYHRVPAHLRAILTAGALAAARLSSHYKNDAVLDCRSRRASGSMPAPLAPLGDEVEARVMPGAAYNARVDQAFVERGAR